MTILWGLKRALNDALAGLCRKPDVPPVEKFTIVNDLRGGGTEVSHRRLEKLTEEHENLSLELALAKSTIDVLEAQLDKLEGGSKHGIFAPPPEQGVRSS